MQFKKVMQSDLSSPNEVLGAMQESIISCIISFHDSGADMPTIMAMKEKVDGVSATMWSLLSMAIQAGNNDEKINETITFLQNQFETEVITFKKIVSGLIKVSKE
jgi:hypothetical protein